MAGPKIKQEFEINDDHLDWLREMVSKYNLADEHKALRILIDYAKTDGDLEVIFKEIRCNRCG